MHASKPLLFKGRAASSNAVSRFDACTRESIDDGWGLLDQPEPALITQVSVETSKSILNWVDSPDIPFDRTINPYRGCEHGCIYCYARPTHAYLGYSPGLDFESRLIIKSNAPERLKRELSRKRYRCAPIALGMNTDAYQPIERQYRLTRSIIECLSESNHPFSLVTKSALVERDIDLLAPMAKRGLVVVYLSITTLDRTIMRRLEPRAAAPQRRLETIRALHEAGIPTGVMVAPVIPALTDHEIEDILCEARAQGARYASYVLLRLPHEVAPLFETWLNENYPMKAKHVMSLIRESRGGKAYQAEFHTRMRGEGFYAEVLAQRFKLWCQKLNFNKDPMQWNTQAFYVPKHWEEAHATSNTDRQGSLF